MRRTQGRYVGDWRWWGSDRIAAIRARETNRDAPIYWVLSAFSARPLRGSWVLVGCIGFHGCVLVYRSGELWLELGFRASGYKATKLEWHSAYTAEP